MDSCRENGCVVCLCEYFTTVVRVVGVIFAIVLWVLGINSIDGSGGAGFVYVIFLAVVVSILEGLFLFETCITSCCDNDGCCGKTWKVVLFLDNWKRSIIYAALSVPCFFLEKPTIILAGVLMIILGILYLARFFKIYRSTKADPGKGPTSGGANERGFSAKTQEYPPSTNQEMSYTVDDEMGKKGDAGLGSLEDRYPK